MRLSNKFTLAYAVLTFFVLTISFFISYQSFTHTTIQSAIGKLSVLNTDIYNEIEQNGITSFDALKYHHTTVELINEKPLKSQEIDDKRYYDASLHSNIHSINFTSYFPHAKKTLKIHSSLKLVFTEDEYLVGILMIFLWTFVFLITLTIVIGAYVSIYLLEPFYKTLNNILLFKVDKETPLEFKDNSTYEFSQLNSFVKEMMQNANKEYKALKEFNENASHELQTPLAVMQSKIDLLLQSNLNDKQMKWIFEINDQIDRLSSIKKSLALLVHLEHFVPSDETINISKLLEDEMEEFEDLLSFKNLILLKEIHPNVEITFDHQLFHILINNLFTNALKYTNGNFVKILLTNELIEISNSGKPLDFDPNEYFTRFIKGSGKKFSSGIGLSIVKKIVDLHQYRVEYHYHNNLHTIKIIF